MAILTKFWADVPFRGFVQMMLNLFEINSADFFPQIASGVLTSNVGVRVRRFFGLSGRVPFEVSVDVQLVACM